MMNLLRFVLAAVGLSLPIAGCGILFLPYGEASVIATATISLGGQQFTGSTVWRVHSQTQNGWPDTGINYRNWVLGDAIEFQIADGEYIFLHPQHNSAIWCAGEEHPGVEYLAAALPLFTGPCEAEKIGQFSWVTLRGNARPLFTNFGVNREGEILPISGGKDIPPDIQNVAARKFALLSLTLASTTEALPDGMVERFPWILQLTRAEGRAAGATYAQFFTTDLPD